MLSALEADMRGLIRTQLALDRTIEQIVAPELLSSLQRRAQQDGVDQGADLFEYLDFADCFKILNGNKNYVDIGLRSLLKDCASVFEKLTPIRNRVMHSRPLKSEDSPHIFEAVRRVLSTLKQAFPNLSEIENNLAKNPDYALSLQIPAPRFNTAVVSNNLPLPEFDETGFLGRTAELNTLLKVLKGPFPIITVLGEGGVGKTALAQQVAYELLDDETQPYQAIVWTTSKTSRLTANDIQRIEGAIETSLGVFRSISDFLIGPSGSGSLDEVLEYLNTFKILLILDNLETVLDEQIRKFLYGLNGGSKILITSRVGTGELNYAFPLSGMGLDEARLLLRATAQVRRVPQLAQAPNAQLTEYCSRMKTNPAYIKWFVTAVQCNKRPNEVLAKPELFLDFCLSNVYDYLTEDAIRIANAFLSVPGRHAQPVLSYLTGLDGTSFQTALRHLITTNMALMSATPTEAGVENVYELGDLPRQYLARHHSPDRREVEVYQKRKKEIVATHERLSAATRQDRYNPNSMSLRTRDDTVIATYLIDAVKNVRRGIYDVAFELVEKAKQLAPSYFEVFRVEAWTCTFAGDLPRAREAYQQAVEIEPRSAPLRYWYGGFLLRNDEAKLADEQLTVAAQLDPESPFIQAEAGRAKMYLQIFGDAEDSFRKTFQSSMATLKLRRIAYDGWLQTSLRKTEAEYDRGEYAEALMDIQSLVEKYEEMERDCLDVRIIETLAKSIPIIQRISNQLSQSDLSSATLTTMADIRRILETDSPAAKFAETKNSPRLNVNSGSELIVDGEVYSGKIERLVSDKKYGFIATSSGTEFFFHQSALTADHSFSSLEHGQEVRFVARRPEGDGRPRAMDIVVISTRKSEQASGKLDGVVKSYGFNGQKFGFIGTSNGDEYFFHKNNLADGVFEWQMIPGTSVEFVVSRNTKGEIADLVRTKKITTDNNKLVELARGDQYVFAKLDKVPTTYSDGMVSVAEYGMINVRASDFRRKAALRNAAQGTMIKFRVGREVDSFFAMDVEVL